MSEDFYTGRLNAGAEKMHCLKRPHAEDRKLTYVRTNTSEKNQKG